MIYIIILLALRFLLFSIVIAVILGLIFLKFWPYMSIISTDGIFQCKFFADLSYASAPKGSKTCLESKQM